MQAVMNESKTKTRAAEDIFYNKYCGKLKIYNRIDLRLSFNSLRQELMDPKSLLEGSPKNGSLIQLREAYVQ